MDNVIRLISVTHTKDEYGVERREETERKVFCQVRSVTRAEFFDGGRNGLNPEYQMTMFAADYKGEEVVLYEDKRYSVYRVYRTDNDYLELYVERKGGTNG